MDRAQRYEDAFAAWKTMEQAIDDLGLSSGTAPDEDVWLQQAALDDDRKAFVHALLGGRCSVKAKKSYVRYVVDAAIAEGGRGQRSLGAAIRISSPEWVRDVLFDVIETDPARRVIALFLLYYARVQSGASANTTLERRASERRIREQTVMLDLYFSDPRPEVRKSVIGFVAKMGKPATSELALSHAAVISDADGGRLTNARWWSNLLDR